jgi:predicted nucleic acid-binding Zn ribbon protein
LEKRKNQTVQFVSNRRPQKVSDVLADLMAQRGYARDRSSVDLSEAWQDAAGELIARHSRVGLVRHGRLEVTVAHSALVQELTFQKAAILAQLRERLPQENIADLRFRVGPTE